MNQDSSFPPMLPPSSELGALLFAVLPCLQETYRPLASFAYHMTELTKIKKIPSVPPLTGLSGIDALVTDKDTLLCSLSFYGKMFRMPLLSTIATLLRGMQFYQAYKDILPGLFSGMGNSGGAPSSFADMAGLFSSLGGLGGFKETNTSDTSGSSGSDLFSVLGGLSPELLSSLFSVFSGGNSSRSTEPASSDEPASDVASEPVPFPDDISPAADSANSSAPHGSAETPPETDDLYNNLYSFLTPEQQKIYEQLMHTD